jgi:ribosomal protein L18E
VALVLAVISFTFCPVIPAIVALFLASSATRKIQQSGGLLTGEGLAKAARIIAWVHLALAAVGVVVIVLGTVLGDGDSEFDYGLQLVQTLAS